METYRYWTYKKLSILSLIMENLAVVLDCDPKFTATQEAKVMSKDTLVYNIYNAKYYGHGGCYNSCCKRM